MQYWLSTKSPRNMLSLKEYETPELAALLRDAAGVDPAILAADARVSAPCIKAYQLKLGVRPITNPRNQNQ